VKLADTHPCLGCVGVNTGFMTVSQHGGSNPSPTAKIKTMKPKFKLTCKAGTYEADTFFALIIEVLKHRFWHLRTHGKWMD